ncbi:MAG: hypothetical protein Q9195_003211 [Heterodermia aff. obscurata]
MLQRYNIPVAFLDIILAFGQKPSSGLAELQYLLTYIELAEGAKENDLRYWTTRQTGLYQKYTRHNDSGLSVLLQPMKQSAVQNSFNRLKAEHENQPRSCFLSLLDIHLIVLSTYFRNWQRYLTVLNDEFEDIAAILFTIQWNDSRDYEDGQERLPRLHALQDRVLLISPRLGVTLNILETLEILQLVDMHIETESRSEDEDYRRQFLHELRTYKALTTGLLESARLLERRMEAALKMVGSSSLGSYIEFLDCEANLPSNVQLSATLNLMHQATGSDTSGGPLKSTTETVSNRNTLQVIAFVTLLSMPATFIATVLGTKLHTYSASGSDSGFEVPWIFAILVIAITLITIGCGLFYSQGTKNLSLKGAGDQKFAKSGKHKNDVVESKRNKTEITMTEPSFLKANQQNRSVESLAASLLEWYLLLGGIVTPTIEWFYFGITVELSSA